MRTRTALIAAGIGAVVAVGGGTLRNGYRA